MMKLMMHMTILKIGRRVWPILLLFPLLMQGCWLFSWDSWDDHYYLIGYKNSTGDTLVITTNNDGGFMNYNTLKESLIYPDSVINIETCVGFMKGEDPVVELFSEWEGMDSCWVYHYDSYLRTIVEQQSDTVSGRIVPSRSSLLVVWAAPFCTMPDSIHSFFNYNSWECWKEDGIGYDGIIQFTIYESDFTGSTE